MEISTKKNKNIVTSNRQHVATDIMLNRQKLGSSGWLYISWIHSNKDGNSTQEIRKRLILAISAMTKLNVILGSNSISFPINMKLFRSLVISIILYQCQSWSLIADAEHRVHAFEYKAIWCY